MDLLTDHLDEVTKSINEKLEKDSRLIMQDLYFEFISEYPDYGPKAKMTISRTRFYRWLLAYGQFITGTKPEEGRDSSGRWFIMHSPKVKQPKQSELSI